MAKTRIVRRVNAGSPQPFDEQQWPVNVALIVTGGFLTGVAMSACRFDDPRLLYNAWTWLLGVPTSILAFMIALRFIGSRYMRRAVQLAMVISVLAHLVFLMLSLRYVIFNKLLPEFTASDIAKPIKAIAMPEYHNFFPDPEQRKPQDFEKPVETENPEIAKEKVERQETEPTPVPERPQPTPTPEEQKVVDPNVLKRKEQQDTAPKHAEQESKLSRQLTKVAPRPDQSVQAPQPIVPREKPPAEVQARTEAVERQQTEVQQQRRPVEQDPATTSKQEVAKLTRQSSEERPEQQTSATPTLQRQMNKPTHVPRTQLNADELAARSEQSKPNEVRPDNLKFDKARTESTEADRKATEPAPETPTQVAAQVQKRELPTEKRPEITQDVQSRPTVRPRTTNLPNLNTAVAHVTPTPQTTPTQSRPEATASTVQRQQTQPTETPQQQPTLDAPTPTAQPTQNTLARRATNDARPTPTEPTPVAVPTRSRTTPTPTLLPTTEAAPVATVSNDRPSQQVAANSTSTAKQSTQAAPVNRATAEPVADAAGTTPSPSTELTPRRTPRAQDAPQVAQADQPTTHRRTMRQLQPDVNTQASNVAPVPAANAPSQVTKVEARTSPVTRTADTSAPMVQRPSDAPDAPRTDVPVSTPVTRQVAQNSPVTPVTPNAPTTATPRRTQPTTNPLAAATVDTPTPTASSGEATTQVAAATTATNKQSTATGAQTQKVADEPTTDAPSVAPSPLTGQVARRTPTGETAPQLATDVAAVPNRRTSPKALPSPNTLTADTAVAQAPTQATSDAQPRPSESKVARQTTTDPTATTVQATAEVPASAVATNVARPTTARAESATAPSILPDAKPSQTPARSLRSAQLAASPTAIESPAVAKSDQGAGEPSAQPARTALAKADAGVAGVGSGANLDRAKPTDDNHAAQVASDSAQRERATQSADTGPALAPSSPVQVARARAAHQLAQATIEASNVAVSNATGAESATELNASAGATLAKADANATKDPVTAAKGNVEVDVGPTRLVAEDGAGRAAGGGQMTLNFETQARQIARSKTGGAPEMALAAAKVAESPEALKTAGGGSPTTALAASDAVAAVRTDPGSDAPVSGGPSAATEIGPAAEVSSAAQVAQATRARTEAAEAVPALAAAGGATTEEDEEEKKKRLARQRLASSLALATPTKVADAVAAPSAESAPAAKGGATPSANPTEIARAQLAAGAPTVSGGGPSAAADPGPAAERSAADQTLASNLSRADRAEAAQGAAQPEGGKPQFSAESQVAPQLARQGGGGQPKLQLAGVQVAAAASSPNRDAGPQAASVEAALAASSGGGPVSKSSPSSGAPSASASAAAAEPASVASAGGQVASADLRRSEPTMTAEGTPVPGGGSGSPTRRATGPRFVAHTQALAVSVAGGPRSSGGTEGTSLAAQGVEARKLAGGQVAAATNDTVGAAAGSMVVDVAVAGQVGSAIGPKQSLAGDAGAPAMGDTGTAGAPLERSTRNAAKGAVALASVAVPSSGPAESAATPSMNELAGGSDIGTMSRQDTGGLAVNVQAPDGPGGLTNEYTVEVGVNTRKALAESVQVQLRTARFVRQQVGGELAYSTGALISTDSFKRRTTREKGDSTPGGRGRPAPQTENAIELGLEFLTRQQLPDGSWSFQRIAGEEAALVSDTAATALCLIAFQGAGYNHREHKYADTVNRAMQFLLRNQKKDSDPAKDGDLFKVQDDSAASAAVWLYSHSFAALALSEAYGMTQDPDLREPAQRALNFIVNSQSDSLGGWRYQPGKSSDTSVTGAMMMALKSGNLAGLDVPAKTFQKIQTWLDTAQASKTERHLFRYNPYAPDDVKQAHGRLPSKTMTSVGLLMRMYGGLRRDDADMLKGGDYLLQNLPSLGTTRTPDRDTYYWYYATQVMFHLGGDYWKKWEERLHPLLTNSQIPSGPMAGSWDPRTPVPDRWGPHAGRLYVTCLNLLSLEVQYRHLPIYEETGK